MTANFGDPGTFANQLIQVDEMDFDQLNVYANLALTWIGFGTVVGLAAKAIMPGRDPGGAIATVLMGIAGSLIGCALLQYLSRSPEPIEPITLQGFGVGTMGAFIILVFYKILGGYWFTEGEHVGYRGRRRRRSRSRERVAFRD